MQTIHATAVVISNRCVLLRGRSGAGKSDLALRLIDGGAILVADDQTELIREEGGTLNVQGIIEEAISASLTKGLQVPCFEWAIGE